MLLVRNIYLLSISTLFIFEDVPSVSFLLTEKMPGCTAFPLHFSGLIGTALTNSRVDHSQIMHSHLCDSC